MSIRGWGRKPEAPKSSAMVDFHEGAMGAPALDAHENQVNFRLEDMSRRVEEIQKRNMDLETKLAAQNEIIRDQTLEKLTTLEGRLAQREDATQHATLQKLATLETCIQQQKGVPAPTGFDSSITPSHLLRTLERLEQKVDAVRPNHIRDRTMDTIERLEGRVIAPPPPTPLPTTTLPSPRISTEIADEYLHERARLYQLRSAQAKLGMMSGKE